MHKKTYKKPNIKVRIVKLQLLSNSNHQGDIEATIPDINIDCGCTCCNCSNGDHNNCLTGNCGLGD